MLLRLLLHHLQLLLLLLLLHHAHLPMLLLHHHYGAFCVSLNSCLSIFYLYDKIITHDSALCT
jgi:hypothetical protein